MSASQGRLIEEIGLELMRKGDSRASALLAIYLAYRFSPQCEDTGFAEVVPIDNFSRKVPCE